MRKLIIKKFLWGAFIPVFALCEFTNVELNMDAKETKKQGSIYRRADVYITVPMKIKTGSHYKSILPTRVNVVDLEDGTRKYIISIVNNTGKAQDSLVLVHEKEKEALFMEDIVARRVISYSPYISEQLVLVPTEIKKDKILIKLPGINPGEEIVLSYVVKGEGKPSNVVVTNTEGIKKFIEEKEVEVLVAKYSFLFGYASTKTYSPNIENIKEVIEGLERLGLKAKVNIVGMADGKTKNPEKNKLIARLRAENVARSIFGSQYACLIEKAYVKSRTGTPSD